MLKSEWSDNAASQELTADELSQVGGGNGYNFGPSYYGPAVGPDPFVPPSPAQKAADAAFYALTAKIVAFQGYIEFTSGPNPQLIIPRGLGGPKPTHGHR